MRNKLGLTALITGSLVVLMTLIIVRSGLTSPLVAENTQLAIKFLANIPNPNSSIFSASPEIVTSVLWDHRGIDTFYETTVLFLAIVGALYVLDGGRGLVRAREESTIITRVVAKLVAPLIAVVASSVAIHGHLTPGGGFQGGAIFVVGPLIIILAIGSSKLAELGLSKEGLLSVRSLALLGIAIVGLTSVLAGMLGGLTGYIFMNLPKTYAEAGFPYLIHLPWGTFLFSGTLMFLNMLEFVAVSAGFTLTLMILDSVVEGERK